MNKRRIGVLVSGRGSNLQALMDEIAAGTLNVEITVVISDKKDAFALERAQKAGIKTVAVERKACASKEEFENKITAALEDAGAELVVLAGFMRILSPAFVGRWHHQIVNIHPALLPSFPGLDGQGQALEYGVKIAGCTVHFVDEGTDSGPIILQKAVSVLDDDTHDTLADRILEQEHKALPEAVRLWSEGRLQIEGRHVRVLPAVR
ncbi:MAG: phosphoribosylglycinamide formyltransferase [Phascolarctobacterium sp.]|nr:MAG: phosphoribosylglycinamide formyltransferase [Phascolarctobacterium sp.]